MSDFLSSLFSRHRSGPKGSPRPLVEEAIERSAAYQTRYAEWLAAGGGQAVLSQVHESLSRRAAGLPAPINAFVVEQPGYSGFYFTLDDQFADINSDYLLDRLRDRVMELEYTLYTSTRFHYDRGRYVEQTEMHYLKPHYGAQPEPPLDQQYGNLKLEKVSVDGKPSYLKVMATTYNDHNYGKPRPFSGLIDHLLGAGDEKGK